MQGGTVKDEAKGAEEGKEEDEGEREKEEEEEEDTEEKQQTHRDAKKVSSVLFSIDRKKSLTSDKQRAFSAKFSKVASSDRARAPKTDANAIPP